MNNACKLESISRQKLDTEVIFKILSFEAQKQQHSDVVYRKTRKVNKLRFIKIGA